MNQRERYLKIKKWLEKVNQTDRLHKDCIRVGRNEGEAHAQKKYLKCRELIKAGIMFITEARVGKLRADILAFNPDFAQPHAIEVMDSEAEESIEKKAKEFAKMSIALDRIKID